MLKKYVFAMVFATSLLIAYAFACVAFSITNKYYEYYQIFKVVTIVTPIVAVFVTTLFLSNGVFSLSHRQLAHFLTADSRLMKAIYVTLSSVVMCCTVSLGYQMATSRIVIVKANDDAALTIVTGDDEQYIGVIPENSMASVRIHEGEQVLLASNDKQIIQRIVGTDGPGVRLVDVDFEQYESEALGALSDQNSDSHHESIERLQMATDDFEQLLLSLDAAQTPSASIVSNLAHSVLRGLDTGELDLLLALLYEAYVRFGEGYILGEWCDEALTRLFSNDETTETMLSVLDDQYSGCNGAEKVLLLKFLEVALEKNPQLRSQLGVLMEDLKNDPDQDIAGAMLEIEQHGKCADFSTLFQGKYNNLASTENVGNSEIEVSGFEIAPELSIYSEKRYGRIRDFALDAYRCTFLLNFKDSKYWGKSTDYLNFIEITNKIAENETLTSLEKAFLMKAKPVFVVTITNRRDQDILLRNIIMIIDSIEVVYGGGTRILRPEIMYEIEVPTEVGRHVFPIRAKPLLVERQSVGQFYIGLNSTNRKVLQNGAIMYPQLYYRFEMIFDFGADGQTRIRYLRVLL